MAPLASYGRQANDQTLVHMAVKIRLRTIRKAGELQRQIELQRGAVIGAAAPLNFSGRPLGGERAGSHRSPLEAWREPLRQTCPTKSRPHRRCFLTPTWRIQGAKAPPRPA